MSTKRAKTWTYAEVMELLPTFSAGSHSDFDVQKRQKLRAGRTIPELDQIATAIPDDATGRLLVFRLAEDDHAAAKAARKAGTPIPAVPFLEELRRRNALMVSTKAEPAVGSATLSSPRAKGGKASASGIHFTHDGKLVSATQNKLSSVAWFYTKPLGAGGGRLKVGELRELLRTLGVEDPMKPGWSVKLANGITLGSVVAGATPAPVEKQAKLAAPEKVAAAKKSTAKKTAKSTAAAARKPAAKKTAPKRPSGQKYAEGVTPKKATAKKGAASAPLAKPMAPRKSVAQAS